MRIPQSPFGQVKQLLRTGDSIVHLFTRRRGAGYPRGYADERRSLVVVLVVGGRGGQQYSEAMRRQFVAAEGTRSGRGSFFSIGGTAGSSRKLPARGQFLLQVEIGHAPCSAGTWAIPCSVDHALHPVAQSGK